MLSVIGSASSLMLMPSLATFHAAPSLVYAPKGLMKGYVAAPFVYRPAS
jgi:hypothetical protein